jgi:hypothetical protein
MAFRFELNESISKGFRRIGLEQIDRAEHELTAAGDPEVAIHETRKCLKRIRALLRLAHPGLGDAVFHAENTRFREIAGLLAHARDTDVLCQTVAKLECVPRLAKSPVLSAVRQLIQEDRDRGGQTRDDRTKEALHRLAQASKRFRRLSLKPRGFITIERGLEASYRKGRRAFAAAYAGGSDEAFHEWRKTVQQHWRHMALISRTWPDLFNARVAAARSLSQMLGDDHDLSVLVAFINALPAGRLPASQAREIERMARARQKELRKAAAPRGRQLFAEGAKGLARRVALMWEAAEQVQACEEATIDERAPAEKAQPGKRRT